MTDGIHIETLEKTVAPDGVSLRFVLGGFADACDTHGVPWSLPTSPEQWEARAESAAYLNCTSLPADAGGQGHFYIPQLFDDRHGYPRPFKLVRARILGRWKGRASRDTPVLAAPVDADGVVRTELAVDTTLGDVCLRKTRELVYNYIGDMRNHSVTDATRENTAARRLRR